MKISVAICTWNRAALLEQTLKQMRLLHIPSDLEWELLVVNNNCTDQTDDVIASNENLLPIRRLFEPEPGQTIARNLAIAEAKGDYIVWTDDDVLVSPEWLEAYQKQFLKHPDAAVFGGPIEPWFEGNPPDWLRLVLPKVEGAYAVRQLGTKEFPLDSNNVPFGANFAVRSVEQRVFLYDPNLGLKGTGTLRGDETTLIRQMFSAGCTGRWVPDAKVSHFIPRKRQTIKFLRGFFGGMGQYMQMNELADTNVPSVFNVPRWLWRKAILTELKYQFSKNFAPPEKWVDDLMKASMLWGRIKQYRSL